MVDKLITKFENYTTIFCFTMMSVVTLFAVFFRYALSNPIIWAEEVSRYLMIWGIFIGLGIVTRKNAQLGIDIIINFTPIKVKKVLGVITNIILILAYIILFVVSIKFVLVSKDLGQLTPILRIKFYLVYLAMPIGFLLCIYRSAQIMLKIYFSPGSKTVQNEQSEVYIP